MREAKKGRAAARFFNSGSRAGPRAPRCVDQNRGAGKGQSRRGWGQANLKETLRLSGVTAASREACRTMSRSLQRALPNFLAALAGVSIAYAAIRIEEWERARRHPVAKAPLGAERAADEPRVLQQ